MDILSLLSYVAAALGSAATMFFVAKRPGHPDYDDPRINSRFFGLAASIALLLGLVVAVLQSFASTGFDLMGLGSSAVTPALSFVLIVSFYTDHIHRKVDRTMLRVALLISVVFGGLRLWELQSEPVAVIYAVAILVSLATMALPSLGASDSRAFMLFFAASIPFLGMEVTYYAFVISLFLCLCYAVVFAIRAKSFKVSLPLVPYILFPAVVAIVGLSLIYGVPKMIEVLS